ncbi:MAG: YicC family protein [Opitutae bacterium]|nr:YicC family protein [Opitutae bacterium]
MKSMTGYGRSSFLCENVEVSVEVSSVNKRNLETVVSLPRDWQALEREILTLTKEVVSRGRINFSVKARVDKAERPEASWDEKRLRDDLEQLRIFAEAEGIPYHPDASLLCRLASGQKFEQSLPDPTKMTEGLKQAAQEALKAMIQTRIEEGKHLEADIKARNAEITCLVNELEVSSEGISALWREKLLERLRQAELELDAEDERVLREVALFAERCDVSEELTRLRSHGELMNQILEEDGPVGRKLEFALQEISRELNTVASKSPSTEVKRLVIEARAECEKIREQALNVE